MKINGVLFGTYADYYRKRDNKLYERYVMQFVVPVEWAGKYIAEKFGRFGIDLDDFLNDEEAEFYNYDETLTMFDHALADDVVILKYLEEA